MFHIEFIVDDKYLAGVLRMLAEIKAQNLETKPVLNAQKKNGKIAERHSGTVAQRTAAALVGHYPKGATVDRATIFNLVSQQGGAAASSVIADLVKLKAIRRTSKRGQYTIATGRK